MFKGLEEVALQEEVILQKEDIKDASFTFNIVAGKNTYVYDAHTYHHNCPNKIKNRKVQIELYLELQNTNKAQELFYGNKIR